MGGQSGSWTPTKRRGPIAAEFQGPGPAAIGLPSLFGSKFQSPLFDIMHPPYCFDFTSYCLSCASYLSFIYFISIEIEIQDDFRA